MGSGGMTPAVIRPAAASGNPATIRAALARIGKREIYARHASRLLPRHHGSFSAGTSQRARGSAAYAA